MKDTGKKHEMDNVIPFPESRERRVIPSATPKPNKRKSLRITEPPKDNWKKLLFDKLSDDGFIE